MNCFSSKNIKNHFFIFIIFVMYTSYYYTIMYFEKKLCLFHYFVVKNKMNFKNDENKKK